MELINNYTGSKYESMNEYFCEITDELDKLAGLTNENEFYSLKHYILADDYCIKGKCLAIRIPGGAVGGIWFDDDNVITKIVVDTDYVVKTYPKDVNGQMKKFIGCKIDNIQNIKQ